jgi:hypothetical protein
MSWIGNLFMVSSSHRSEFAYLHKTRRNQRYIPFPMALWPRCGQQLQLKDSNLTARYNPFSLLSGDIYTWRTLVLNPLGQSFYRSSFSLEWRRCRRLVALVWGAGCKYLIFCSWKWPYLPPSSRHIPTSVYYAS